MTRTGDGSAGDADYDRIGDGYAAERLLDPAARRSCSAWSFVAPEVADGYVEHLRTDLDDGTWDARSGHLRTQPEFEGSLVLVVSA